MSRKRRMGKAKPLVISLFAGCGGSSLGYRLASFEERLAVEWDQNAAETFRLNFPGVPLYQGDVAKLSVEDCLRLAKLKPGELTVLDGSPPCQGFSLSGKRKWSDTRNVLFVEYVRLLKGLKPKAFVMENVKGLIMGVMRKRFLEMTAALRGAGYRIKAQVMNAMYYGVPQSRERVIIIGFGNDLNIEPSHPKPQTRPVSLCEAVKGADVSGAPRLYDKHENSWRLLKPGQSMADIFGSGYQTMKLNPLKPAPTLTKSNNGRGFATPLHWAEPRALSVGEMKRIASFPDDFKFIGPYKEQAARIGNCVPPNLMKAIAEHIKHLLDINPSKRGEPWGKEDQNRRRRRS